MNTDIIRTVLTDAIYLSRTISVKKLLLNKLTLSVIVVTLLIIGFETYIAFAATGEISGTVLDADGEPVEGAEVTLTPRTTTGVDRSLVETTSSKGEFMFSELDTIIEYDIFIKYNEEIVFSERKHLYFKGQAVNYDDIVVV
jgi:hypothetical protein